VREGEKKMFIKEKVAYNKDRTESVVLRFMKEFHITDHNGNTIKPGQETGCTPFHIRGYFNKQNFFDFGEFDTVKEAREFLESIHRKF